MKDLFKILAYAKRLKKLYFIIGFFTIVIALLGQLNILLTKGIIDRFVAGVGGSELQSSQIIWLAVGIFVSELGTTVLSNVGGYYGDIMSARLKRILGKDYFEKLLTLPQKYYDTEKTGSIVSKLDRTMNELGGFMNMLANNFLQFIVSTVLSLSVVAYFAWDVALLLALLYPIFLYMTTKTSKDWQAHQKEINKNTDISRARFTEAVSQVKTVRAYTQESSEVSFFDNAFGRIIGITRMQSRGWHVRDVQRRLVMNVIFFFVTALIVYRGIKGTSTIGEMVLLIQYAGYIRIPIFSMSFLVDATQRAMAGSREFFEIMDLESDIEPEGEKAQLRVDGGEITYKGVHFAYNGNDDVLSDITFTAHAGTKLALVGESGQGKSTITNLLLRFYEPKSGVINIDGQNIAEVSRQSVRDAIGMVFQSPSLFSGTIKENIAYGKDDATDAQIEQAARQANAHEFISKLKKSYDTEIGERGVKLSGGQQQRVAIARAILNDPPILVLDEATSSLDNKAEAEVQDALEKLMHGRTTIIIAHRLSTIKDVDTIVTFKDGRVDEVGSPEELAKTEGIYAMLLKLQETTGEERKELLKKFDIVS